MARAMGVDVDVPILDEQIALFDEWLAKEPERLSQVDSDEMELRRALGVA